MPTKQEAARARVRRILWAAGLLAAVVIVVRLAFVARDFDAIATSAAFDAARSNHTQLRAFLHRMPKGGDLHTHLTGAVYAERFIAWAAKEQFCINLADTSLAKPECKWPAEVSLSAAMHDQKLYDRVVDALSMRTFLPSAGAPTAHDKFFATFGRFGPASGGPYFVAMVVDQLRQYDDESIQYVEFMTSFGCPGDRDKFVRVVGEQSSDSAKLTALQANGLDDCATAKRRDLAAAVEKIRRELACDSQNSQSGCSVTFRFIAQNGRNSSPDDVFVQTAIAAALIRAEPQVVALNLVQAEDSRIARDDYDRHMRIVGFLAKDDVAVTLHAGELWLGLVPPTDLTFHIRQAVEIAGARRIGHGVALAFEHDMQGLLGEMRDRPVAVEINLTSNDIILGVRGKDHPLPMYLAAGVPVVLSTDDAGVSRIDVTNEYFRAARDYGLSYRTLKAIARTALLHSFLDEKQKGDELKRFDRSSADFERAQARSRPPLQNILALLEAAVSPSR
jgi:adenosine deaminase